MSAMNAVVWVALLLWLLVVALEAALVGYLVYLGRPIQALILTLWILVCVSHTNRRVAS